MSAAESARAFDVIIYGATGFTGRLVTEHFVARAPHEPGLTWAMAGRDRAKLERTRDELGADPATVLIVVDPDSQDDLARMARQARVVLTTVGPYQLYGSSLVAACAAEGVDYVDLCGEPAWMRDMILAHEAAAKASGARIVFSCGFDSIPFDLGVLYAQKLCAERADVGRALPRMRGRVTKMAGGFSGGTAASLKATMAAAVKDPSVLATLRNPFSLTPGFEGPAQPHGMKPLYDDVAGVWLAPFIMAPINTRNVHRTNFLLGHPFGRDFVYDEMLVAGQGDRGKAVAEHIAGDKSLMKADGPKPGEGPSFDERMKGHFEVVFAGLLPTGGEVCAVVSGDRDPGYGATSRMISEAAIHLARDLPKGEGGIFTPGAVLGLGLIPRLEAHAGMQFKALG